MAKDINAMENVQKFACRMATHKWNLAYNDLISLAKLSTLEGRRLEFKLGQLFEIVHNLCFFPEDIVKLKEQTPLLSNTRSLHPLYLHQPRAHTNSYQYSFVPHTCSVWNSLTFDTVNASSLNVFRHNIMSYNY